MRDVLRTPLKPTFYPQSTNSRGLTVCSSNFHLNFSLQMAHKQVSSKSSFEALKSPYVPYTKVLCCTTVESSAHFSSDSLWFCATGDLLTIQWQIHFITCCKHPSSFTLGVLGKSSKALLSLFSWIIPRPGFSCPKALYITCDCNSWLLCNVYPYVSYKMSFWALYIASVRNK